MAATVEQTQQTLEHYRLHADVCRVLTDPKRLMLIAALRAGERSVGELALEIGAALPNASQHLAVLRTAGLVDSRRVGTTVVYRLAEPDITDACDIISAIVARRVRRAAAATAGRSPGASLPAIQG
jgi:ArsR family transcriptional regulator